MAITFDLGAVEAGTTRLDHVSVDEAIARATGSAVRDVERVDGRNQLIERSEGGARCEAWSVLEGGVHASAMHAFAGAVQIAFDQHLPLLLSPDQVWILLAQGAATHVQLHAEQLRERFVSHQGQETIRVRRDDFVKGASDNPWPEMVEMVSEKLRAHLGKKHDLFVADFSTTGPLERTVSQVVLMGAMERYFELRFATLCGIPRVTLLGTPADWRDVRERARVFRGLELDWWLSPLEPILDGFVDAAEGRADRAHWCSMYKLNSSSGGPYVTGWLQLLFPYLNHGAERGLVRNDGLSEWREGMTALFGGGPKTNQFPGAISGAPFVWEYLGEEHPMELLAGFIGVRQDRSSGAVTPQLGWGVTER